MSCLKIPNSISVIAMAWALSGCALFPSSTETPPSPGESELAGEAPLTEAEAEPEIAPPPSPKPEINVVEDFTFPKSLSLCPRMTVSNAPSATAEREISNYGTMAVINGTRIAVAPVEAGCFSSGFGSRNGRPHKGIDLHNAEAVDVFAAANGWVREKIYRDDYGNMLVIQHGDGVFARYAHLQSFAANIEVGDRVETGQTIGIMGNTASYTIPRHLHYEVLTGEWGVLTGSFGLTPVDIMAHIAAN